MSTSFLSCQMHKSLIMWARWPQNLNWQYRCHQLWTTVIQNVSGKSVKGNRPYMWMWLQCFQDALCCQTGDTTCAMCAATGTDGHWMSYHWHSLCITTTDRHCHSLINLLIHIECAITSGQIQSQWHSVTDPTPTYTSLSECEWVVS